MKDIFSKEELTKASKYTATENRTVCFINKREF